MSLTSWTKRLTRRWGCVPAEAGTQPRQTPTPVAAGAPPAAPAPASAPVDPESLSALQPVFLHWLFALPPADKTLAPQPPDPYGRLVLEQLDAVIASDVQCASLLPRAAQVVPQLMKAMRDERYSAADVAQRISKDVVLTTEVIRLANSVHRAGKEPIVDVGHAVTAVGSDGLRRAIAKVVLRPVFEARTAPLSIAAAPHIWIDADRKSRLGAALSPGHGVDPLDGYLAGLLHNTGWTALLRALDSARPPPSGKLLLDPAFVREMLRRRDVLFGKLVKPWQISPALTALAEEVAVGGLAAAVSPLAQVLRAAEELATRHALQRSHDLAGSADALAAGQPKAVQECLATIDRP